MPVTHPEFDKLRVREAPVFANINLLGACNVDCYFCLGKDIDGVFKQYHYNTVHFSEWENFDEFLDECRKAGIQRIYVTGQNTDALVYKYIDELVDYVQGLGFDVGMRTNGYLLPRHYATVVKCRRSVGVSIHSLDPETNFKIMGRRDIPDWNTILPQIPNLRVSVVLCRYNEAEFPKLLSYLASFPNVKYIQVRRICTDTREDYLLPDVEAYERVYANILAKYGEPKELFYDAGVWRIHGKDVCFWRTVKTTIGSYNYYVNGVINKGYFVIEGFAEETIGQDADPLRETRLEGYWKHESHSLPLG